MKNRFGFVQQISVLLFLIVISVNACKIDSTSQFKDIHKLEELLSNFQQEIKSDIPEMQMGFENKNGDKSAVIRLTFNNVKINLMDSTLVDRSKDVMKAVYEELKDKDQFDKYSILYNKDPSLVEIRELSEVTEDDLGLSITQINHVFLKEDLK